MAKSGGFGFGMVVLLIVMAVVLVLTAKAWKSVAPTALDVNEVQSGPVDDHGETGAASEVRSGTLPRLQDAKDETDEHSQRVQEALDATE